MGPNPLCHYSNTTEVPVALFWSQTLDAATCQSLQDFVTYFEDGMEWRIQHLYDVTADDPQGWFEDSAHYLSYDRAGVCVYFNVTSSTISTASYYDPADTENKVWEWQNYLLNYVPSTNGWAIMFLTDVGDLAGHTVSPQMTTVADYYSAIGLHTPLHEWGHTYGGFFIGSEDAYKMQCVHTNGIGDITHYPAEHAHEANNLMRAGVQGTISPDPDNRYKPNYSHVYFND